MAYVTFVEGNDTGHAYYGNILMGFQGGRNVTFGRFQFPTTDTAATYPAGSTGPVQFALFGSEQGSLVSWTANATTGEIAVNRNTSATTEYYTGLVFYK